MSASWPLSQDPYAAREAGKYDSPVPSREYILQCLEASGKPLTHDQLVRAFDLTDDNAIEALRRRLIAMERDAQLFSNRRKAYALLNKLDLIKGRVQAHKDGYGFLIPEDGRSDLYLHARQMRKVWSGDVVLVRDAGVDQRGRSEAVIVEVLERALTSVVGRLRFQSGGFAMVTPENARQQHELLIPGDKLGGAHEGDVVEARIIEHPGRRQSPVGEVVEVLGAFMAAGMEIDIALRAHEIPHHWPEAVEAAVEQITPEVQAADLAGRIDLRDLPLVTIDGEDAKDFDDAVYCQKQKSGSWKLYVAIADVSHYVRHDEPLDQEAFQRGNSVYFPGRVVPMLPEVLSNGLCSLNPQVDRLCMVCEMNISAQGRLTRYRFYEGVMRSKARLTYTQVGAFLDDPDSEAGQAFAQQFGHLVKPVRHLHALYQVLRQARTERGAIDFDTVETRIVFGEDRKIDRIVPVERNDAHKLIEECMLCANVATARFLAKHKLPGLYRVHEGPSADRLQTLKSFLAELGLSLGGGDEPTPSDYLALAAQIEGRPDKDIIQTMMLRSMQQAVYTPHNEGHFGLAYQAYAHFTSPIRRYPDLLVHRAIRGYIRSGEASNHVLRADDMPLQPLSEWAPYSFERMLVLGEHCSMTERRADDAVRDVTDWLKCEYLSDYLGEQLPGTVASVVGFGLFVRLNDIYVEGLVHISSLPQDYYHFEPEKQRLKGERSGRSYRLGDGLDVIVARVDLDERNIDFELADPEAWPRSSRKPRRRNGAGGAASTSAKDSGGRADKSKPGSGKKRPGKAGAKRAGGTPQAADSSSVKKPKAKKKRPGRKERMKQRAKTKKTS